MYTNHEKVTATLEHADLIMNIQLALLLSDNRPRKAIRDTTKRTVKRLTSSSVRKLCDNIINAQDPVSWFRAHEEHIIKTTGVSVDTFIGIGLEQLEDSPWK